MISNVVSKEHSKRTDRNSQRILPEFFSGQTLSLGCHIHNGTYLTLSLTLTITLTLPTLLTLILGTVVNMAP